MAGVVDRVREQALLTLHELEECFGDVGVVEVGAADGVALFCGVVEAVRAPAPRA